MKLAMRNPGPFIASGGGTGQSGGSGASGSAVVICGAAPGSSAQAASSSRGSSRGNSSARPASVSRGRERAGAGKPRGVEQPFFLIEIPAAILLCHQAALQAVGEPCHRALQARQLLVEIGAQPVEFFLIGEVGRTDNFVIFGRPAFVIALR